MLKKTFVRKNSLKKFLSENKFLLGGQGFCQKKNVCLKKHFSWKKLCHNFFYWKEKICHKNLLDKKVVEKKFIRKKICKEKKCWLGEIYEKKIFVQKNPKIVRKSLSIFFLSQRKILLPKNLSEQNL